MKFNKGYNVTEIMNKAISEGKLDVHYKTSESLKVYIAKDVWDVWVYRVHENLNEDFEYYDGKYLIEIVNISKEDIAEKLVEEFGYDRDAFQGDCRNFLENIKSIEDIAKSCMIIDMDRGLENWDTKGNYWSIESVKEEIGYGSPILTISCA